MKLKELILIIRNAVVAVAIPEKALWALVATILSGALTAYLVKPKHKSAPLVGKDVLAKLLLIQNATESESQVVTTVENAAKSLLLAGEATLSLIGSHGVIVDNEGSISAPTKLDTTRSVNSADQLVSPILRGGEVLGFLTVCNKQYSAGGSFNSADRMLLDQICSITEVALTHVRLIEKHKRDRMHAAAIVAILRCRQSDEPLSTTWRTVVQCLCDLFNPQFASIFVCDQVNCEVFNVAAKEGENIEGLTLPFGKGFVGTVAETGKSVRTENAYSDPRFFRHVDSLTGQQTRTLMCIPVPGFQRNSRPIAVIQVINKLDGKSFLEEDEAAMTSICAELSTLLRWKSTELNELRHRVKRLHVLVHESEDLECAILREYGAGGAIDAPSAADGRNSTLTRKPSVVGPKSVSDTMLSYEEITALITNHNTDPFALKDTVMIDLAVQMISSYGLLEKFHIDVQHLQSFLQLVRSKYRPSNPFHNFYHAWGVMHLSFVLLRAGGDAYLTDLDILALLLSAVCHDLDHPGNNNAFETAIRSELAILYSDDAVLERHHLAVTHQLLENPTVQVLAGLTPSERIELRSSITSAILATDMSQHFKILDDILRRTSTETPYSQTDVASRKALIGHLLHSADIGAQTQCREVALQWTDRLVAEFSWQASREIEMGIPLTPFLHGLDDECKKMQLQVGFLNGVVTPLWTALASVFPDLENAVAQLERNKTFYASEVDRLTAQKMVGEPFAR